MTIRRPVLVVAGARPNFMKVVPIIHELDRRGWPRVFVHTGQHYDFTMSDALLADLQSPPPDEQLDVGSGSHAVQTARAMERFEPVLRKHRPSWVVVVGDVNSTLACALVTAKLRGELECRIAHVEAGLRSHDWTMPEEVNRVLTDRLSDLLFIPIESAMENIVREGLSQDRTCFVGNVMIDALFAVLPRARELRVAERVGVESGRTSWRHCTDPLTSTSPSGSHCCLKGYLPLRAIGLSSSQCIREPENVPSADRFATCFEIWS